MKKNMGNNDRVLRLVLAALFVILYLQKIVVGGWGIALLVLAGIFALTSIAGYCPLYTLLRIKTGSPK